MHRRRARGVADEDARVVNHRDGSRARRDTRERVIDDAKRRATRIKCDYFHPKIARDDERVRLKPSDGVNFAA